MSALADFIEGQAEADRLWNLIDVKRRAGTMTGAEERDLRIAWHRADRREHEARQLLRAASWAFCHGAVEALMNADERSLFDSGYAVAPLSETTDDFARAAMDGAGRQGAARKMCLARLVSARGERRPASFNIAAE